VCNRANRIFIAENVDLIRAAQAPPHRADFARTDHDPCNVRLWLDDQGFPGEGIACFFPLDSFPGLTAARDGARFWPSGRVRNRLVNGPEDNVWHYYQVLVADHGGDGEGTPGEPSTVPKSSV
jgi:hypothetical protein